MQRTCALWCCVAVMLLALTMVNGECTPPPFSDADKECLVYTNEADCIASCCGWCSGKGSARCIAGRYFERCPEFPSQGCPVPSTTPDMCHLLQKCESGDKFDMKKSCTEKVYAMMEFKAMLARVCKLIPAVSSYFEHCSYCTEHKGKGFDLQTKTSDTYKDFNSEKTKDDLCPSDPGIVPSVTKDFFCQTVGACKNSDSKCPWPHNKMCWELCMRCHNDDTHQCKMMVLAGVAASDKDKDCATSFEELWEMADSDHKPRKDISGGIIAGIVISVIVIVGMFCWGLRLYIINRRKDYVAFEQ